MVLRLFPKGIFPSGNFSNVKFPKRKLHKGYAKPCCVARIGGPALRLE